MEPAALWVQFSVIGILVLAAGAVWREMRKFIAEQDAARIAERETQRKWQAEQDKVRDERWQAFLKSMQDEWIAQDGRHTETLLDLIKKVDELLKEIKNHDQYTREAIVAMRERVNR